MEYYAHTREDGERQTVKAHLIGVSKLAEDFSVDLLKPLAIKSIVLHPLWSIASQDTTQDLWTAAQAQTTLTAQP